MSKRGLELSGEVNDEWLKDQLFKIIKIDDLIDMFPDQVNSVLKSSIYSLPIDIIAHILSFVPLCHYKSLILVSKTWYGATKLKHFWNRHKYNRLYKRKTKDSVSFEVFQGWLTFDPFFCDKIPFRHSVEWMFNGEYIVSDIDDRLLIYNNTNNYRILYSYECARYEYANILYGNKQDKIIGWGYNLYIKPYNGIISCEYSYTTDNYKKGVRNLKIVSENGDLYEGDGVVIDPGYCFKTLPHGKGKWTFLGKNIVYLY